MVYECDRRSVYACTVPVSLFDSATMMRFWYGNLIHSRPLLLNSKQEVVVEYEGICGHVDEYQTQSGVMLEKKSTASFPDAPHKHHIVQAEYYYALLHQLGFRVKDVFIVYFYKDLAPTLPIVFKIDTRGASFILDEMRKKRDIIKMSQKECILPQPMYGHECGNCPYPSLCFGNLQGVRE